MESEQHSDWPLPFVPAHLWGLVLEKEGARLVLWVTDLCVEAASPGSASEQETETLHDLAKSLRDTGVAPNAAQLLDQLEGIGYREVEERRYDFQSGTLYQHARVLADLAVTAAERRRQLLVAHGGRHPPPGRAGWTAWERVVMTMNSTVMAAWVLTVAAVEALVNEILLQRFPDDYREMELRRRGGFAAKLRKLCERIELDPGQEWVTRVVQAHSSRSDLVHHKPRYVKESRNPDSLEPLMMHDPHTLLEFLGWVDIAFEQIFGAFDLEVPPTHRPHEATEW